MENNRAMGAPPDREAPRTEETWPAACVCIARYHNPKAERLLLDLHATHLFPFKPGCCPHGTTSIREDGEGDFQGLGRAEDSLDALNH